MSFIYPLLNSEFIVDARFHACVLTMSELEKLIGMGYKAVKEEIATILVFGEYKSEPKEVYLTFTVEL